MFFLNTIILINVIKMFLSFCEISKRRKKLKDQTPGINKFGLFIYRKNGCTQFKQGFFF